jgi:glycosyltransferase involved in cell wall biosynthesis
MPGIKNYKQFTCGSHQANEYHDDINHSMSSLHITASMDPTMGGPPQGLRFIVPEIKNLGIAGEVVCCDASVVCWAGKDSFPVHTLGPSVPKLKYTPKLSAWLDGNLHRFSVVVVHGIWVWPSLCAARAVARERRRRLSEGSGSPLRFFVMSHGMLDPWFQRDKSRRVKAVRNWFYWWLVERNVVNSADALLFTCQQELELARTTFKGYRPKREINVGYGVAEPPAFGPEMREAFAAKCPGLNGRPYLLFMSRIHAKKNVAALVRAYARIASEHGAWSLEPGATEFSHSRVCETAEGKLTRIDADESERLGPDRTTGNASCRVIAYGPSPASGPPVPAVGSQSQQPKKDHAAFPDLVIAGPGWDSDYGREVRGLIDEANRSIASTEHRTLNTEHSAPIHSVDMLSGAAKWGALYGCEAFVLPSHQENFGIAVVEALACGKPVLISDQVNIWREIADADAGFVEVDTEDGAVRLLKRFMARKGAPEMAERARECYLSRFAIGPAASNFAQVLKYGAINPS